MLDLFHVLDNPKADIQKFWGNTVGGSNSFPNITNIDSWQTWRKPRGANWIYILAVGAGASGGCERSAFPTSSSITYGGHGGQSGSVTTLLLPAAFVPDVLYILCGIGGRPNSTQSIGSTEGFSVRGSNTIVSIYPDKTQFNMFCFSQGGAGGRVTGITGLTKTQVTSVSTIFQSKGFVQFGQSAAGANGAAGSTAAENVYIGTGYNSQTPKSGSLVTGGCGGGSPPLANGNGSAGGSIVTTDYYFGSGPPRSPIGNAYITFSSSGGKGGVGNIRADDGVAGSIYTGYPYSYFTGGGGGGGASWTNPAGQRGGNGGDGAPGCGGGGAGGAYIGLGGNSISRPGAGGDGFVWIISW